MSDKLYFYNDPFYGPSDKHISDTHLESLTVDDKNDLNDLYAMILKFTIDEELIKQINTDYALVPETNTGSWKWHIQWMNFRSLVDDHQHAMLISSLYANSGYGFNTIVELHNRIGIMLDERLLNYVANRTMRATAIVPYVITEDRQSLPWNIIYVQTPFIWVMILTQTIIRLKTNKKFAVE